MERGRKGEICWVGRCGDGRLVDIETHVTGTRQRDVYQVSGGR